MRPAPAPIHVPEDEMILRSEGDTKVTYELPINGSMPFLSNILYCSAVMQKVSTIYI